jgi:ethanolamine utilization protein EutP (predicted NTPase)
VVLYMYVIIFIHSFSVNPAGSTNSCGCGNRPTLQYNKNKYSLTYSNTTHNIEYNSSVHVHSKCHKFNHHLYESMANLIQSYTMSVTKSHSYKNSLQN